MLSAEKNAVSIGRYPMRRKLCVFGICDYSCTENKFNRLVIGAIGKFLTLFNNVPNSESSVHLIWGEHSFDIVYYAGWGGEKLADVESFKVVVCNGENDCVVMVAVKR